MSDDTAINRASIKHAYQQVADAITAHIAADRYPQAAHERDLIVSIHGRGSFIASALAGDSSCPPR